MTIIGSDINRVIVGMGLTGLSCARYFAANNLSFRVVDSRESPSLKAQFLEEFPDVDLRCGEFTEESFAANDLLIVSPGMSMQEPAIKAALEKGASYSSDIELFLQQNNQPIIAITGSNGKSTVTTLVAEILKDVGMSVCMAGNIGLPVLDQILTGKDFDIFVLELSSFQLERLESLGAEVATILNLSEDHMDRYDGFQQYHAAKQKVYSGARHAIVNRDDKLTEGLFNTQVRRIDFGLSMPDLGQLGLLDKSGEEWICIGDRALLSTDSIKIKGRHNVANVMAALAIVSCLDIDLDVAVNTVKAFKGLEHRCQWVAEIDGVEFFNDSKATNVGAAVAAITGLQSSYETLYLIAGGVDKDSDFRPLVSLVGSAIDHVFLIGVDAEKIAKHLESSQYQYCDSLSTAVADAKAKAGKGDAVLLAPACASFDMFANYEARGDAFVDAVAQLGVSH